MKSQIDQITGNMKDVKAYSPAWNSSIYKRCMRSITIWIRVSEASRFNKSTLGLKFGKQYDYKSNNTSQA